MASVTNKCESCSVYLVADITVILSVRCSLFPLSEHPGAVLSMGWGLNMGTLEWRSWSWVQVLALFLITWGGWS